MSKETKSRILAFLQAKKFDLMRQVPGFVDAALSVEDSEPVLLLKVAAPLEREVEFAYEDEILPVKVEIATGGAAALNEEGKENEGDAVVVAPGDSGPQPIKAAVQNDKDKIAVVAAPNEVAISPHQPGGRNRAAFEAWKKRHRHVKVFKG